MRAKGHYLLQNFKIVFIETKDLFIMGNWKTQIAGTNGNGNGITSFFAYCFDNQVSGCMPPCGTSRLTDKNSDLYMLA